MTGLAAILQLGSALRVRAGDREATIEPVALLPGESLLLVPPADRPSPALGIAIARVLGTVAAAAGGRLELLGNTTAALSYVDLLRLRARIGYVHSRGGLLSNRSVADNIALPLSIHGGMGHAAEAERVRTMMNQFGLALIAERRPHELDIATHFRTAAARALVLSPSWVVVEGTGDFDATAAGSLAWRELLAWRDRCQGALVVVLGRPNPLFEQWFAQSGGQVQRWRDDSTDVLEPHEAVA